MKKNGTAHIILAIFFALVNVIAFVAPTEKTTTFWIAYAFTIVAFAAQIGVWKFSFKSKDKLKSKFLGISLISVGIYYLLTQIIVFALFLIFPSVPSWIAVIISSVILGFALVCLISTDVARKEIERVEANVGKKVFFIKALQVDIEMIAQAETNADIKEELNKLAQKVRFSDPMSADELADLEAQIIEKSNELKIAVNKLEIISALDLLLTERNKKAKLLK